jgi:uncharacterized protein DUF4058
MPSPFPGMDPYIEAAGRWGDFHGSMAAAMRAELNARLPRRYAAEIELYVWIEEPPGHRRRQIEPDLYLAEQPDAIEAAPGAVVAAPAIVTLPRVRAKKRKRVQIVDRDANRVVTAIELLSPSNKGGEDRDAYLAKRGEYLASQISLVEIDLLRRGRRLPLGSPAPAVGDYYVLVCRAWEYPRAGFWTFGLRDDLPEVPVPLAAETGDVLLPLRPCVDRAYDEGRYFERLPYDRPLSPRPRSPDAVWIRDRLAARHPQAD